MNKKYIWLAVAIIALGLVWWALSMKSGVNVGGVNPLYSSSPSASSSPVSEKAPAPSLSYTQALNQYANRRIQFDSLCHGTPGQMIVKKGTKIMIDNRASDKKTFKFQGLSYSVAGWNFAVATVTTTKTLPYTESIDCKSSTGLSTENVITITIE